MTEKKEEGKELSFKEALNNVRKVCNLSGPKALESFLVVTEYLMGEMTKDPKPQEAQDTKEKDIWHNLPETFTLECQDCREAIRWNPSYEQIANFFKKHSNHNWAYDWMKKDPSTDQKQDTGHICKMMKSATDEICLTVCKFHGNECCFIENRDQKETDMEEDH